MGLLTGSGVMTLAFIGIEHYQQDKGLLPPRFFKDRNMLCAMLVSMFSFWLFSPLFSYP